MDLGFWKDTHQCGLLFEYVWMTYLNWHVSKIWYITPPARNSRARSQAQTPCSAWHNRRSMAWGWKGCVPWPCGVRSNWVDPCLYTKRSYYMLLLQSCWASCQLINMFNIPHRVFGPDYDTTHQTQRGRWSRHNPRNKAAPGAQSVPCSIPVGSTHPDLRRHGAHGYRSDAKIFQMTHTVFIIFPGPSTWLQASREKELLGFEIMVFIHVHFIISSFHHFTILSCHHPLGSSP